MFLLQALQSFLGDIGQWPATILNHLFIDAPTPEIIKKVSAFFMEITSLILLLNISTISLANIVVTTQLILCTLIILSGEALAIQFGLLYIIT
jgi:hypothetical protein